MGQYWIPTLVKSPHAFLSTLCIASAHLDAINNRQIESVQTLALRQEVIHLIGQNLVNPDSRVDDFNVIALTQLIASEIVAGEEAALSFHESGVATMVKQRGGVGELGVDGRLASTLSWVSLESAVLRETKPATVYSDFCSSSSSKSYPNTATIPESPLFCPRNDFETIKRSQRCKPRTLDLLRDIRMMMELFLHETEHSRQNAQSLKNLYKKITSHYPSAAELQKANTLTHSDWTYEAIRIAAIIQATSIIKRVPFSEALKHCAQRQDVTQIYTVTPRNRSSESLVSPTTLRSDSPVTSFSTDSSYITSPAFPTNPFTFVPSLSSASSARRTSSDIPLTPAPNTAPNGSFVLLQNLKTAIQNSNVSDCWGDMAGVLLWIGLTAGAASRKSEKVTKKWFSALAMRCSIVLCFEHPEPVHATLLKMGEMVAGTAYRPSDTEIGGAAAGLDRSGSLGTKRRRM